LFKTFLNKQSTLIRSLSALLALVFVLHTGYVNATVMECYTSGKSQISLGEKDFCCASIPVSPESVSAKCCGFEKTEKTFDRSQVEVKTEFKVQPLLLQETEVFLFSIPELYKADEASLKSPPLLAWGYDWLKLVCVFRL
jgi:hypothetical protein